MSCHGNQNEILGPRMNEFKDFVEGLLDERGYIEITKEACLFICKK